VRVDFFFHFSWKKERKETPDANELTKKVTTKCRGSDDGNLSAKRVMYGQVLASSVTGSWLTVGSSLSRFLPLLQLSTFWVEWWDVKKTLRESITTWQCWYDLTQPAAPFTLLLAFVIFVSCHTQKKRGNKFEKQRHKKVEKSLTTCVHPTASKRSPDVS
jgi:hypothetical protein